MTSFGKKMFEISFFHCIRWCNKDFYSRIEAYKVTINAYWTCHLSPSRYVSFSFNMEFILSIHRIITDIKMLYEPLSSAPRKNEPDASKRPNITRVGEFSVNKHRNFLRGERTSARYLRNAYTREEAMKDLPHVLDLRQGYPSWVKSLRNNKFSQIQKWIIGSGQWGASLDEVGFDIRFIKHCVCIKYVLLKQ